MHKDLERYLFWPRKGKVVFFWEQKKHFRLTIVASEFVAIVMVVPKADVVL